MARAHRIVTIPLMLLLASSSCGGGADAAAGAPATPQAPFQGPPVNLAGCPTPAPPAPISDEFPDDIELPPSATSLRPPVDLPNGVRVDLHIPDEVKPIQRFFVASLKGAERRIVATDYEGWEAEVYFSEPDGRPGLIQLRSACSGGTNVSIEIFDLVAE